MNKMTKQNRRERAKAELALRVIEFLYKFKSKEEPTIKLTNRDEIEVLANIVARRISRLPNTKK